MRLSAGLAVIAGIVLAIVGLTLGAVSAGLIAVVDLGISVWLPRRLRQIARYRE